jgi:hypothetical protein
MALDPNAPLFPTYWDDDFEARYQAALGGGVQQFRLPGELAKQDIQPAPPPPPPPPQTIGPGMPAVDEVAASAPPLSPEEEAQIQIDQPALSPEEEAQIQIDQPLTPSLAAPDAVSGGITNEQGNRMLGLTDAHGTTAASPDAAGPDEYASDTELGQRYANRSGDEQLKFRTEHEEAQQNFGRARLLEESRLDVERQQAHGEALLKAQHEAQQKRQQVDAEAQEVANTSPLDTISTGRKIAGIAAAIVGGFAMNKTGRNVGLEAVGQMIDEAAAEQATKLQTLQGKRRGIGEDLATAGDMFQTQETMRLGMWDHFIRNLETEVQNYDPRGTTAIRTMDAIGQARTQRAQALDKFEKDDFDRRMKLAEFGIKQGEFGLKYQEMLDKKAKGLGGMKPPKFEDVPRSLTELRALGVAIPDNVTEPAGGISLTQAKKLAEGGKSAQEWAKATRENSPEDRARQLSVGEIVDDQGDPVQFRSTEFAGKLAGTKASVDTVSQYADEMVDLYREHGFESDFLKSPAWMQAQGAFAAALLEAKNGDQLGALSGSDLDLEAKKITGGVDVTGLRDPVAAINSFKRRMGTKLNSMIRAEAVLPKGRSVKPWSPPNTAVSSMSAAKGDDIDELGADLTKALYKQAPKETGNPLDDANSKIANEVFKPLNEDVDKKLNIMIANAAIQNDRGDRARKYLRGIAEKAVYPEMKAKAQAALDALPGAHVRTER